LVFRIGNLGDSLVTLPAFRLIKKAFPASRLTLLSSVDVKKPHHITVKTVVADLGLFEDYVAFPLESGFLRGLLNKIKLVWKVRKAGYDAAVYLTTRNRPPETVRRDMAFFEFCGIRQVYGADYARQNLIDETEPRPLRKINREGEFLVNCLISEGLVDPTEPLDWQFRVDVATQAESVRWLHENCGTAFADQRLIAIAPGSKWESKVWPEERYISIVKRLIKEKNVFPVIFGGREDKEKAERMIAAWQTGAIAAGALNIKQSAAALSRCRLYLGNDTGTMHLAAAAGIRCVAIFSAIDWEGRWYPFGDGHRIFREKVTCEGCFSPVCAFNNECLTTIDSNAVEEACLQALDLDKFAHN
jgi:ADP-heptose:LPS heptosyltransferase